MIRASRLFFNLLCILTPFLSLNAQAQPVAQSADRMALRTGMQQAGPAAASPALLPFLEEPGQRKSSLLAVLYSVLLPGMGELYAGRGDRMLYPLVAEGVLWLGFAGVNVYAVRVRDDARVFARQHAGAPSSGPDDSYYVALGNYNSIDEYNDAKLVARDLEAVYAGDLYAARYWKWDEVASRLEYKDQRILSDDMFNAGRFFVAGLVINRIFSAVESAFFVRRHNEALAAPQLHSGLLTRRGSIDGLRVSLTYPLW
jgi:hypothetical protein